MAQTIKLKRTATPNNVPTTAQLELGEIAVNTYDGKVYIKKNDGAESIVEVTNSSLGNYLPLAGGTLTGNLAINNGSPELYFGTTGNHYNWRIAAQELVDAGFEIAVGSQDTDYSNDTYVNKFVVKASGNVGINVSSPTSPLHIRSAANVNVRFDDSGSSSYTWYMNDAQNLYIPNVQLASTHTFYANGQRKVDIDSSGNVGIGTTAPASNLHIKTSVDNSVAQGLVIERSANSDKGYINYNGGGFQFRSTVGDPIVFGETDAEHMRILPDGNVGIGTDAPNEALEVKGSIRIDNGVSFTAYQVYRDNILYGSVGGGSNQFTIQASNSKSINLFDDSGVGLTVKDGGNVGIGTSSPDSKIHLNDGALHIQQTDGSDTWFGYSANNDNYITTGASGITVFRAIGTERVRIDSSGNVGIGTSSTNGLKTAILGATGYPATSGTTQTGVFRISGGTGLYNVLDMGVNEATDTAWMQATRANSLGTYDKLVINPYGGNVGIGTSSPTAPIHVSGSDSTVPIKIQNTGTGGNTWRIWSTNNAASDGGGKLGFYNENTATRAMTLDSSGNVGIGTSSPFTALDVSGGTTNQVGIFRSTDATATVGFADNTTPLTGNLSYVTLGAVGNNMVFNTNLEERMRIDSSGRLLLNATSTAFSDKLYVNGDAFVTGGWRVGTGATYTGKIYNSAGVMSIETDSNRDIKLGSATYPNILYIDSSTQNVGIGTSAPSRKVSVWDTVNGYNLELQQRSAYNSGNQSGVVFSAKYHSDGSVTDLASIRGGKENTTDNNYAGKA
jgi:hypothetical protein